MKPCVDVVNAPKTCYLVSEDNAALLLELVDNNRGIRIKNAIRALTNLTDVLHLPDYRILHVGRASALGSACRDSVAIGSAGLGLQSNISGVRNTAVGSRSLAAVTGANDNTSIGAEVGMGLAIGGGKVFVGSQSGNLLTNGTNYVLIGASALSGVTNSTGNVVVGNYVGPFAINPNNNVVLGDGTGRLRSWWDSTSRCRMAFNRNATTPDALDTAAIVGEGVMDIGFNDTRGAFFVGSRIKTDTSDAVCTAHLRTYQTVVTVRPGDVIRIVSHGKRDAVRHRGQRWTIYVRRNNAVQRCPDHRVQLSETGRHRHERNVVFHPERLPPMFAELGFDLYITMLTATSDLSATTVTCTVRQLTENTTPVWNNVSVLTAQGPPVPNVPITRKFLHSAVTAVDACEDGVNRKAFVPYTGQTACAGMQPVQLEVSMTTATGSYTLIDDVTFLGLQFVFTPKTGTLVN